MNAHLAFKITHLDEGFARIKVEAPARQTVTLRVAALHSVLTVELLPDEAEELAAELRRHAAAARAVPIGHGDAT